MSGADDRSQLLTDLAEIDDPTRTLFELIIAPIAENDPGLAEVLRACTIPGRIDAAVVGVIRDSPPDDPGNEEVLAELAGLRFVSRRPDGSLAFRESVRSSLLEEWRSSGPEQREAFERITDGLVHHYEQQHDSALILQNDLTAVASLMSEVHRARFTRLSEIVEAMLHDPLREAVYQEILRSAQRGMDLFEKYYSVHEASGRYTLCAALLGEAQIVFGEVHPDAEAAPFQRWLRYWEARLARGLNDFDQAEDMLRELAQESDEDARLGVWVRGELGAVLQQRYRLGEALAAYRDELALADATSADPWNAPVSSIRLGSLHGMLGDFGHAESAYRDAIAQAEETGHDGALCHALVGLAEVLITDGRREAAFEPLLRAFDLARTALRASRDVQIAVNRGLMKLVSTMDPELLDTAWEEARGLSAALGGPAAQDDVDDYYVNLLYASGRLQQAELTLAGLARRQEGRDDSASNSETEFTRALMYESQGRLREAIGVYDAMLSREAPTEPTPWTWAAALSNRGIHRIETGSLDEAENDLREARLAWSAIGSSQLETVIQAWQARRACRLGELSRARALLDDVQPKLEQSGSRHLVACLEIRAELLEAEGRWSDAAVQLSIALQRTIAYDDLVSEARSLARLVNVYGRTAEWREAAKCAQRASTVWDELDDRDGYVRSDEAAHADEGSARATIQFTGDVGDRTSAIVARDHLRGAIQRRPGNFIHSLNQAYVCGALEEWAEGADALQTTLESGPEGIGVPMLYERLAAYRFRQAAALQAEDDDAAALRVLDEADACLTGKASDAALADLELAAGDSAMRMGRLGDARVRYEQAAARLASDPPALAGYKMRCGILAALEADAEAAATLFEQTLQLADAEPDDLWALMSHCSRLVGHNALPALDDALRILMASPAIGGSMSRFTPQMTIPLPPGWTAKESITLVAPDGRANLVASSEGVGEGVASREYAELLGAALLAEELPEFREISFTPVRTVDGRECWKRSFEWNPPEGATVSQTQLYFVEDGRGYAATATSPREEAERYELQLGQLLTGLTTR